MYFSPGFFPSGYTGFLGADADLHRGLVSLTNASFTIPLDSTYCLRKHPRSDGDGEMIADQLDFTGRVAIVTGGRPAYGETFGGLSKASMLTGDDRPSHISKFDHHHRGTFYRVGRYWRLLASAGLPGVDW